MKKLFTFMGMAVEHYVSDSNLPTIVFLHDSLGSIVLWRDFPEKLAKAVSFNYLIYDRLGYGKSENLSNYERPVNYLELEADILFDLLNYLRIDDAILFGHSDGGSIALIYGSKYPDRTKALICEAGHIFVEEITLQGIQKVSQLYQTTDLSKRLAKYHGDKSDAVFKTWTQTWCSDYFKDWNIEYLLINIKSPLLFIQGEFDEYGTLLQVESTIKQVSGPAEKFIVPKAGHTPHKEFPLQTLEKAISFIVKNL